MNPITWVNCRRYFFEYANKIEVPHRLAAPKFEFYENDFVYHYMIWLRLKFPAKVYSVVANLIGNPEMKKNAKLLNWVTGRADMITEAFYFFVSNEWIFDCFKSQKIFHAMNKKDQATYNFNLSTLSWREFVNQFSYGILVNIMKQESYKEMNTDNLIIDYRLQPFRDVWWSMTHGNFDPNMATPRQVRDEILNSPKVMQVLRELTENESNPERAMKL